MNKKIIRNILLLLAALLTFFLAFQLDKFLKNLKQTEKIIKKTEQEMKWIPAGHPYFQYTGRFNFLGDEKVFFAQSGCSVTIRFTGTKIHFFLKNYSAPDRFYHSNFFSVFIDSLQPILLHAVNDSSVYKIENLEEGEHQLILYKRTEAACGLMELKGVFIEDNGEILPPPPRPKLRIEFIGNSITAGYGNEDTLNGRRFNPLTENHYLAYPSICARLLKAEHHSICYSGKGIYRNYDKSLTETLPTLYTRIYPQKKNHWNFSLWQPHIIVVNAGTNDFGQGIPPVDSFVAAYTSFLIKIRKLNPESILILVDGPLLKNGLKTDEETGMPINTYSIYMRCLNMVVNNFKRAGYSNIYQFSFTPVGKNGYGTNWHPSVKQHQINAEELSTYIRQSFPWLFK